VENRQFKTGVGVDILAKFLKLIQWEYHRDSYMCRR